MPQHYGDHQILYMSMDPESGESDNSELHRRNTYSFTSPGSSLRRFVGCTSPLYLMGSTNF